MTIWNDIVLLGSLLLLSFMIWKEAGRPNRAWRKMRLLAVILIAVGLAGMGLPVALHRHRQAVAGAEGVLLTEGYRPDSLRQLLESSAGTKTIIYHGLADWINAQSLTGQYNLQSVPPLSVLHVLGYGLTIAEWDRLREAAVSLPPINLHPSPPETGIAAVSWQRQLYPGQVLLVQGRCDNTTGKPLKLVLTGPGSSLDSVEAQSTFTLHALPAQTGRAIYHLRLLSGGRVVAEESLPVEVLPVRPLKILLVASAPGPENRFLADWLAGRGHALAIRTTISRDKWDKRYLNRQPVGLEHISPALLEQFDLLITDAGALRAADGAGLEAIRSAVARRGMGLVVRADTVLNTFYSAGFSWQRLDDSAAAQRLFLRQRLGMLALQRDSMSRITAGEILYGAGRIVLTTVQDSYQEILAGHSDNYSALWSSVLGEAAAGIGSGTGGTVVMSIWPAFPRVNEPMRLYHESREREAPGEQAGPVGDAAKLRALYFEQDPLLSFRWRASYWPETGGWHYRSDGQGDTSRWYVFGAQDWRVLRHAQAREDSRAFIAGASGGGTASQGRPGAESPQVDGSQGPDSAGNVSRTLNTDSAAVDEAGDKVLVSKLWFCIPMLLGLVFLWIEKKNWI